MSSKKEYCHPQKEYSWSKYPFLLSFSSSASRQLSRLGRTQKERGTKQRSFALTKIHFTGHTHRTI